MMSAFEYVNALISIRYKFGDHANIDGCGKSCEEDAQGSILLAAYLVDNLCIAPAYTGVVGDL